MIVIFNTLITRSIYKQDHIRRTLTIESDASSNERTQTPRSRMPQTKVTKMLMLVSSAFFFLNMPSCVFRLLAFINVRIDANHELKSFLRMHFISVKKY
jgi:hypothetical protein